MVYCNTTKEEFYIHKMGYYKMTKEEFIKKNWHIIYKHLFDEAVDMECCDDRDIDDYIIDSYCHIFVGTKEEVEDEFEPDWYSIIAQDNDWLIVESFGGYTYDGTEYGIV